MAGKRVRRDVESLGGPGECECRSVKLFFRHLFLVEVSFAHHEEMAGCVIRRCSVAGEVSSTQFEDVSVAIHTDVVGDVDPSVVVLVVPLVLPESCGGVAVVAQNHGGVVDRHALDGVWRAPGPGRASAQASRHRRAAEVVLGTSMGGTVAAV